MPDIDQRQHNGKQNWQKTDVRILGQLLAAQNIIFTLPNTKRIAEFFAQALILAPGVTACRVCFSDVSVSINLDSDVCRECEVLRKEGGELPQVMPFGFKCRLSEQSDLQVSSIPLETQQHTFGFLIFKTDTTGIFEAYKPFIINLGNYIALSLENRLQKNSLQKARDELELRVEERTEALNTVNKRLNDEIAEQQQTELALRHSEGLLKKVLETLPVGVWIMDKNGKIIQGNPAGQKIWGGAKYVNMEQIGEYKGWRLDTGKKIAPDEWVAARAITKGEMALDEEVEIESFNGVRNIILNSAIPIKNEGDEVVGAIMVNQDITKRKMMEIELHKSQEDLEKRVVERTAELEFAHKLLLHAEKLGALGKLAGSIAHEFNNPLFGITMILERLKEKADLTETQRSSIMLAINEAGRMARMIRNLQDFYGPSASVYSLLDINETIEEVLQLFGNKLDLKKIKVVKNFAKDLPKVNVVTDQIKQVFLNIISNAEEAMFQSGGCLTLETRTLEGKIHILFKDTGCGIPKENLSRLFEPFFSTKAEVKGRGLGLPISYGIIKNHKGNILVESTPNVGSIFTVELPIERDVT